MKKLVTKLYAVWNLLGAREFFCVTEYSINSSIRKDTTNTTILQALYEMVKHLKGSKEAENAKS